MGRAKIEIKKIENRSARQAGKAFSFGHPCIDYVIDKTLKRPVQMSTDKIEKIRLLEKQYNELLQEVESETERYGILQRESGGRGFWWEENISNMNLAELKQHAESLEALYKMVMDRAKFMQFQSSLASVNSYPQIQFMEGAQIGQLINPHVGGSSGSGEEPYEEVPVQIGVDSSFFKRRNGQDLQSGLLAPFLTTDLNFPPMQSWCLEQDGSGGTNPHELPLLLPCSSRAGENDGAGFSNSQMNVLDNSMMQSLWPPQLFPNGGMFGLGCSKEALPLHHGMPCSKEPAELFDASSASANDMPVSCADFLKFPNRLPPLRESGFCSHAGSWESEENPVGFHAFGGEIHQMGNEFSRETAEDEEVVGPPSSCREIPLILTDN